MSNMTTTELTLEELVSLLAKFPSGVLPQAVMEAIISHGEAANDVLLSRLETAVQNEGGGLGSIPPESFFCFALLHNSPNIDMLPTLSRVFELNEKALDEVVGELRHGFIISLILRMSNTDTIETVRAWADDVIQNPKVDEYVRWSLAMTVPQWVKHDLMTREAGVNQLKSWLEQRSEERYDTLSGGIVCELLNLKAIEQKPVIEQCFDRGQIDEGLIDRKSVTSAFDGAEQHTDEIDTCLQNNDLIRYFQSWHGYPVSSESVDPHAPNAKENNQSSCRDSIRPQQADRWFDAIRKSNYDNYPRDAVDGLIRHANQLIDRLADEVRWGLTQVEAPESQVSNGPFIATTILAAQRRVQNTDVLLEVLDLTADQRENIYSDSIELSIVMALASGLLGDCRPIDERIADNDRDSLGRSCLAFFYPLSVFAGYLSRQDCIDRLTSLLNRSIDEDTIDLPDTLYDSLRLMSVDDDAPVMKRAKEHGVCNRFVNEQEVKLCVDNPSEASDVVWKFICEFRNPRKAIEESVMFNRKVHQTTPKRTTPALSPARRLAPTGNFAQPDGLIAQPVNDSSGRIPRNATCTCGSGKKYKKCCGKR